MSKAEEYLTIDLKPLIVPITIIISSIIIAASILGGLNNIASSLKTGSLAVAGSNTDTKTEDSGTTTVETISTASDKLGLDTNKILSCVSNNETNTIVSTHLSEGTAIGIAGTPGFIIGKINGNNVEGLRVKGAFPFSTFEEIVNAYLNNDTAKIAEISSQEDTGEPGTKLFPAATTSIADSGQIGSALNKVAIVEYTDLDCFYCQRNHKEVFPTVKSQFIDTNKILYVTRNYPIDGLHPDASNKAKASECVRKEYGDEVYYQYIDLFLKR